MRYMYCLASVHQGILDCAVYVFFSVSSSRNHRLCGICIFLASVHQGILVDVIIFFF